MALSGSKFATEKEMLFCLLGQMPQYSERTIAIISDPKNPKGPHLRFVSSSKKEQLNIQSHLKLWSVPFDFFKQGIDHHTYEYITTLTPGNFTCLGSLFVGRYNQAESRNSKSQNFASDIDKYFLMRILAGEQGGEMVQAIIDRIRENQQLGWVGKDKTKANLKDSLESLMFDFIQSNIKSTLWPTGKAPESLSDMYHEVQGKDEESVTPENLQEYLYLLTGHRPEINSGSIKIEPETKVVTKGKHLRFSFPMDSQDLEACCFRLKLFGVDYHADFTKGTNRLITIELDDVQHLQALFVDKKVDEFYGYMNFLRLNNKAEHVFLFDMLFGDKANEIQEDILSRMSDDSEHKFSKGKITKILDEFIVNFLRMSLPKGVWPEYPEYKEPHAWQSLPDFDDEFSSPESPVLYAYQSGISLSDEQDEQQEDAIEKRVGIKYI